MMSAADGTVSGLGDADPGPIAIGITGHRLERMAGFDLDALAVRIGDTLRALEDAAPGVRFRLVGSLAEGADTIAARVALERGWQIDAVLPFDRSEYARDFDEPGTADGLQELLAQATDVFELPGTRSEAGGEAAAYERAGRVVLAQCELLLAVWDGGPPQGRGGAAQIVAEAIGRGLPIVTLHPDAAQAPVLLWSGLNEHQLGPESIDSIARGGVEDLHRIFALIAPAAASTPARVRPRRILRTPRIVGIAYPLLLALTGVRRLRRTDFAAPRSRSSDATTGQPVTFDERVEIQVTPFFERADAEASVSAQLFRGAFVSNFALAAIAVSLSLIGLVASPALKSALVLGEFFSIATILLITRIGGRVGWHQRWLEQRRLAERLRCLTLSAELGDLSTSELSRQSDTASRQACAIARNLGLPSDRVTATYLEAAHGRLVSLLSDQIEYLMREARRMHALEHRLHRAGGVLFATTALICAAVLASEAVSAFLPARWSELIRHPPLGLTILSAALPAIGAAIYGIRMQGDFAGAAERNTALTAQLVGLRRLACDEEPQFDGLQRLVRRTTELLTEDVSQWFRASLARPLSLPG